jgi:hypothetical protein
MGFTLAYFGAERIRARVAQALPKWLMGARLLAGMAPGWARGVIGQEPSSFWLATRKATPRATSRRPHFAR